MKESNSIVKSLIRVALKTTLAIIILFIVWFILMAMSPFDRSAGVIFEHIFTGWFHFLKRAFSHFTLEPGIITSLVVGFGFSSLLIHWLLGKLRKSGKLHWGISHTAAILFIIPVMFATSFIIPGIILMLRTPFDGPITERRGSRPGLEEIMNTRNLMQAVQSYTLMYNKECYPANFSEIIGPGNFIESDYFGVTPEELGYLYPGANLRSDPKIRTIILVSPKFMYEGVEKRYALFSDGSGEELTELTLDAYLKESVAIHSQYKKMDKH